MKRILQNFWRAAAVGALVACLNPVIVQAAATNVLVATRNLNARPTAAKSSSAPEAVLAAPVPQSAFNVPRKSADGKDPFFPNSTRVYGAEAVAKAAGAPTITADLSLKGISGTPEQPLAIINTTTFTTGEANEVITKSGRVRVQVVEINMALGTVLLQIGSERRELRLAPLK